MSFKIREEHVNMFADFMEEHLEFARGRLSCSNAREGFKKLWSELCNNLNSLGYGVRTVDKWQRTWSDYKLNLKKRASELKKEQTQTGGGPPIIKKLCETDCRILNILGETFYQGCGVKEQGFAGFKVKKDNLTKDILSEMEISMNQDENTIFSPPSTSSSLDYVLKRKTMSATDTDDHDYLATPSFSKKIKTRGSSANENQTINAYYEETIQLLRNIDQNTKNMNETFKNMNSTIDEKLSELCGILKNKPLD